MIGTLQLRGTERTLKVPLEWYLNGDYLLAREFNATDRSHFGVRQGEFSPGKVVGPEANVVVQFEALKTCFTQGGP